MNHLIIKDLGVQDYLDVWHQMQEFTDQRDESTADQLWCLQHPPVFTQGQAGKAEHLLNTGDIPVIPVDRGGQVTYHGPGQLVVYCLIDIRRLQLGVRDLVCAIEQAVINTLSQYELSAHSDRSAPGVYLEDGSKICSVGLRIRHGRSFHGLALNVRPDLEPFLGINPCGYSGLKVTSMQQEGSNVSLAEVQNRLVYALAQRLGYNEDSMRPQDA